MRPFRLVALLAVVACLTAPPVCAVSPADLPESGGSAEVVLVVDGDTVALADGRQVRLVGIQAPKLPLGRPGFVAWPLADAAKAALEILIVGKTVAMAHGGRPMDRHGRVLAHLFLPDGTWVQGRMLALGMARVYTFPDNRALAAAMYAEERAARAERKGIWAHPFYAVRNVDDVGKAGDGFHVVEGRIVATARVKGRVYLNFGADWRTDFTVMVERRDAAVFDESGIDLLALKGKHIRVRGWVRRWNGPLIEASHPEQIEVFD